MIRLHRVSTYIWLLHYDFNEKLEEKAKRELHEDASCCLKNSGNCILQNAICTATPPPAHLPK